MTTIRFLPIITALAVSCAPTVAHAAEVVPVQEPASWAALAVSIAGYALAITAFLSRSWTVLRPLVEATCGDDARWHWVPFAATAVIGLLVARLPATQTMADLALLTLECIAATLGARMAGQHAPEDV